MRTTGLLLDLLKVLGLCWALSLWGEQTPRQVVRQCPLPLVPPDGSLLPHLYPHCGGLSLLCCFQAGEGACFQAPFWTSAITEICFGGLSMKLFTDWPLSPRYSSCSLVSLACSQLPPAMAEHGHHSRKSLYPSALATHSPFPFWPPARLVYFLLSYTHLCRLS